MRTAEDDNKMRICITIDKDALFLLDMSRGMVPRSTMIEHLIRTNEEK